MDGPMTYASWRPYAPTPTCVKHTFWAYTSPKPKRHIDRFSSFCTAHLRVYLYFTMGRPFPLYISPCYGGSGPHLISGSLGPYPSPQPNGILIGSAVFPVLTTATDRPTDRQTDRQTDRPRYSVSNSTVTIGRIYVAYCGRIFMTSGKRGSPS